MSLKAALNGGKAKLKEEVGSTLRFEIKLEKPTDSSTNEVHYTDLLNEKNSKVSTQVSIISRTFNELH